MNAKNKTLNSLADVYPWNTINIKSEVITLVSIRQTLNTKAIYIWNSHIVAFTKTKGNLDF